jgi:hypothetical protein
MNTFNSSLVLVVLILVALIIKSIIRVGMAEKVEIR